MKKQLFVFGFLMLGLSFQSMANDRVCGKIKSLSLRKNRIIIQLEGNKKTYKMFGSEASTLLALAKVRDSNICLSDFNQPNDALLGLRNPRDEASTLELVD